MNPIYPVKLSVYGILIDGQNQILLHKRCQSSFANGWWSLPGGHVEVEESLSNAIQRELLEELGIQVCSREYSCQLTLVRKPLPEKRYINFFYSIKNWTGEPFIADDKASELGFFPFHSLPEPILPYIKEALELIHRGVVFHESIH